MPKKPTPSTDASATSTAGAGVDEMLLAAAERGSDSFETGRYIMTFKEGAVDDALQSMKAQRLRVADARDFADQALSIEDVGDAEAIVFPEVNSMVITGPAFAERGMSTQAEVALDAPIEAIEPEYFVFADGASEQYLQGFMRAAETIARDLGRYPVEEPDDVEAEVLGATWGLVKCKVPPSLRSGAGIRVAVLDTGMDLGHTDFAGRVIVSRSFVGQPVQDLHSHGTHCIGTACGPKAPPGTTPRYGIGYKTQIYVGKVLSNSGGGTTASVLAGMNWAIANKCAVISMSLSGRGPVQAAYTAAGQAALNKGCLIVAAAGNESSTTGAPANSPTILSVASLEPNLTPSSFSNFGKIDIAAPGRDVFSSVPRPTRYGTKTGTSMATPHVAGCAALWAELSPAMRGQVLWNRLLAAARPLPFPASRVGKGLVQAP
jgi:subtilisin family serine protease